MFSESSLLSSTRNSFLAISISLAIYGVLRNIQLEDERLKLILKIIVYALLLHTVLISLMINMNMISKDNRVMFHVYMNMLVIPLVTLCVFYIVSMT
jgi:hypothetical protein